jgi:hypothetical protein
VNCKCQSIAVDANNSHFSIDHNFVVDKIEMRVVRYFGESKKIYIWKEIKILGTQCFAGCKEFGSITFEKESRLSRIEDSCFSNCS